MEDPLEVDTSDEQALYADDLIAGLDIEAPDRLAPEEQTPEAAQSAPCPSVAWWYQNPAPTPWHDGTNCYVESLPAAAQGFVWSNNWYVQPGPGNSCSIGWHDGANCYIGSPPAGGTAFIWNGTLYYSFPSTPTPPVQPRTVCVTDASPALMMHQCEVGAAGLVNLYRDGTLSTSVYISHSGDPCPGNTSIVPKSQFYVANSCAPVGPGCNNGASNVSTYQMEIGVHCL